MRESIDAQSTAPRAPPSGPPPPSGATPASARCRNVRRQQQLAVGGWRDDRQSGRRQHDDPVVARRRRPRRQAAARVPLADRTPAHGAPGDHPIGGLGATTEGGAQPALVEVMARGQKRHARIERVRRGDQQRVERLEQIELRPLQQIAPVGKPRQQGIGGGDEVGPPQPVETQEHRQARPRRSVGREVVGRRGSVIVLDRRRLPRLLARVGLGGQRPFAGGWRRAVMGAARRVARAVTSGGTTERQILQLVEAHAGDLDVDGTAPPARPEPEPQHDQRQVHQHRQPES